VPIALKQSEVNHLRRLLGWVDCAVGPSPEEYVETVKSILPYTGEPSQEGKLRLVNAYNEAQAIPKYVREAVKSLRRAISEQESEVAVLQNKGIEG